MSQIKILIYDFRRISKQGDVSCFKGARIIILNDGFAENIDFISDLIGDEDDKLIDLIQSNRKGNYVDALWCENGYTWSYNTPIPHAAFNIIERQDRSPMKQQGIVFSIEDLVRY